MELLSQVLISGVTLGSLYALVGLGFVVIYRATKVVNFAQGEMMMLGAILALYFFSDLSIPYFAAFLLAVVLCGMFGARWWSVPCRLGKHKCSVLRQT